MGKDKGVLAPGRTNWNLCLALTAFNLSDTGDLQEKLALFATELHLAQDLTVEGGDPVGPRGLH